MAKPAVMPARNALEMAEETYHVLRASARHTLPYYYLGAAPFVAGAIYFWADLRRHPFAEERTAFLSLGLVLLFIWMKAWQSLFARRIHAAISEIEPEPLAPSALMRLAVRQAFLHSLALVLLPLCLLIVFPFGWAYALVQSYTLTEDGSDPDGRAGLLLRDFLGPLREAKGPHAQPDRPGGDDNHLDGLGPEGGDLTADGAHARGVQFASAGGQHAGAELDHDPAGCVRGGNFGHRRTRAVGGLSWQGSRTRASDLTP